MDSLDDLIAAIALQALPAGWYSNHIPEGVLHHVGIALQETPAWTAPSTDYYGGYSHAIRYLERNATSYDKFYKPVYKPAQASSLFPTRMGPSGDEIKELHDQLSVKSYSSITQANKRSFDSDYGAGTGVTFQGFVFAPWSDAVSGQDGDHDYATFATFAKSKATARGKVSKRNPAVYANIGVGNNTLGFDNELKYKFKYPMLGYEDQPLRLWVDANVLRTQHQITLDSKTMFRAAQLARPTKKASLYPDSWKTGDVQGVMWLHPVLDVTRSEVVKRLLASISALVGNLGPNVTFLIGGEFATALWKTTTATPFAFFRDPSCTRPIPPNCDLCRPVANYSSDTVAGFRQYLKTLRACTIADLNDRWGLTTNPLMIFADIDPANVHHCAKGVPVATEDFVDYLDHLRIELYIAQYAAAKAAETCAVSAILSFGHGEMEQSWLRSDQPCSGRWYGNITSWLQPLGAELVYQVAAGLLSGKPAMFPITSPGADPNMFPSEPENCRDENARTQRPPMGPDAPTIFQPRCIPEDSFRMLFRDLLAAGTVNIGYYRTWLFGWNFGLDPMTGALPPWQAFEKVRDEIVDSHPDDLAFMTPYHAIAVHLDQDRMADMRARKTTSRFFGPLLKHLEENRLPHALFTDDEVTTRQFAKAQLRRSLLISSFHKDIFAPVKDDPNTLLLDRYRDVLFSANASGKVAALALVLVGADTLSQALCTNCTNSVFRLSPRPGFPIPLRTRTLPAGLEVTLLLYSPECIIALTNKAEVDFLSQDRSDLVNHVIAAIGIDTFDDDRLLNPTNLTSTDPTTDLDSVHTTTVTDGLNLYAAISNRHATNNATVKISVDVSFTDLFKTEVTGFVNDGSTWPLTARQTVLVPLYATVGKIANGTITTADLIGKARNYKAQLDALNTACFDTKHGARLIDHVLTNQLARPVSAKDKSRALAALVAIKRMLFLKVSRVQSTTPPDITVLGRYIDPPSGGPSETGLEVQALYPLQGHDLQDPGTITSANGLKFPQLQTASTNRWDFDTKTYGMPSVAADDPVEIHVYDPAKEAHTWFLLE